MPTSKGIVETLPYFAKHGGDWYGTYIHVDVDGNILDQHHSHLIPVFTPGSDSYTQTNIYTWDDGRQVEYGFTGVLQGDKVIYDTDRIYGESWEADANTLILKFHYKGDPNKFIYEYLHLSDDAQHRTRIWHWFDENGEVYKRTLIKETRTPPE